MQSFQEFTEEEGQIVKIEDLNDIDLLSDSIEDDSLFRDLENSSVSSPQSSDLPFFSDQAINLTEENEELPSIMESEIDIFEGISFVNDPPLDLLPLNEDSDIQDWNIDFSGSSSSSGEFEEEDEEEEVQLPKKRGRKPGKKANKKQKIIVKEEHPRSIKSEGTSPTKNQKRNQKEKTSESSSKRSDEKYQKRLMANKKSAQASRERKKALRMKLEESVTVLTGENSQLGQEIEKLETENKVLKKEFANLQNLIQESNFLTSKMIDVKKITAEIPVNFEENSTEFLRMSKLNGEETNAASMYLMVLLYSFSQQLKNGNPSGLSAIQGILNHQTGISSPVMV